MYILPDLLFQFDPQLVLVSCGYDAAIGCKEVYEAEYQALGGMHIDYRPNIIAFTSVRLGLLDGLSV